ncbi:uncharacterized protein LOC123429971 [Hordeum vulgare subsp. vulgare]|uniref:uncharacterized protein LOC123429971 n=1 Tax=Hordeum vulgare subsp. vulgare TaxID=112509 RepID=UPI00162E7072|nr:uncharacterized protein LOC123429971 [Hordeum vulgare subsp. vulgare]
MAREGMRAQGIGTQALSILKRIGEYVTTKMLRCSTENDVATGAYNIPEPRSARMSAALSLSKRRGEGPSTTTTVPRHDSFVPLQGQTSQVHVASFGSMPEQTHFVDQDAYMGYDAHIQGDRSQPYPSTRGIRMPEETRFPEINQHTIGEGSQSSNNAQEINDASWGYEETKRGVHKQILIESHDTRRPLPGIVDDFFGEDLIGPSYIPSESQLYIYNFESSSQYGLQTPPPMHESQTQEQEGQYGRGLREHRPPNHLSPSGRR